MQVKLKTTSFDRDMKKLKKKVKNMKPVLKMLSDDIVDDAETRVRSTKIDPDGFHWKQWQSSTFDQRSRTGGSLMYLTGHLSRQFRGRATKNKMIVTNDAEYAGYLHFGTNDMKKRPLLGWGANMINTANKLITKWFK